MKSLLKNAARVLDIIIFVLLVIVVLPGCSKSNNSSAPGANEVFIESFAFNPSTITVSVNTTITWTNKDAVAHTVTSDSPSFDSNNINTNQTYTHQFTVAGTYPYHCSLHPTMLAKVIVQ